MSELSVSNFLQYAAMSMNALCTSQACTHLDIAVHVSFDWREGGRAKDVCAEVIARRAAWQSATVGHMRIKMPWRASEGTAVL